MLQVFIACRAKRAPVVSAPLGLLVWFWPRFWLPALQTLEPVRGVADTFLRPRLRSLLVIVVEEGPAALGVVLVVVAVILLAGLLLEHNGGNEEAKQGNYEQGYDAHAVAKEPGEEGCDIHLVPPFARRAASHKNHLSQQCMRVRPRLSYERP